MNRGTKAFFISYICTVLTGALILTLLMTFWHPVFPDETDVAYNTDTTLSQAMSREDGGLVRVLFYCSLDDKAPHTFFLMTYDPTAENITVQALDSALSGAYRGENLPLPALHRLFGVRSVESGAEDALDLSISATVYADRAALLELLEELGPFTVSLSEDMEYTEIFTGRTFMLSAGEQTLSPSAAAGLLATLEQKEDLEGAAMVLTCLLQQQGPAAASDQMFLNTIFGICETNLTAVQTQLAEPVLRTLFSSGKDVVVCGETILREMP